MPVHTGLEDSNSLNVGKLGGMGSVDRGLERLNKSGNSMVSSETILGCLDDNVWWRVAAPVYGLGGGSDGGIQTMAKLELVTSFNQWETDAWVLVRNLKGYNQTVRSR